MPSENIETLSDGELAGYLSEYIALCRSENARTIFFCPKYATHYIDKDRFILTSDYVAAGNANYILERIETLLPQFTSDFIPAPQKMLGDSAKRKTSDCFCEQYRDYLYKAVKALLENSGDAQETIVSLRERCEAEIREEYTQVIDFQLIANLGSKAQNLDIVLIAPTDRFARDFRARFGKDIFKYIPYHSDSNLSEIEEIIKGIRRESNKVLFVAPELFRHGLNTGITGAVYRAGYWPDRDLLTYDYRLIISDFIGYYSDIFNNRIEVQAVIKVLDIRGGAVDVFYGKSELRNTSIKVLNNASVTIAAGCTGYGARFQAWAEGSIRIGNILLQDAEIRAHTFAKLSIGDDCIFSNSQMIYSGDGHAIFAVLDEKTKKTERVNRPENSVLRIGNHVWVGYRCHILTGADIGDGCIIGAGSFVGKRFPNNCVIAGVPARIIHRNRIWDKNWTITDTGRNPGLAPYIRETKEEQNE